MHIRTSRQEFLRLGFGAIGLSSAMLTEALRFEPLAASAKQQGAFQDPSAAAINCLMDDDTQCAVDVWEQQFALEPYNDQTREALHLSLMAHAVRSLDKGILTRAQAALKRSKELVPSAAPYAYLEEALATYDRAIYSNPMNARDFTEVNESDMDSRFVEIPGILGGPTKSFAMTAKNPGYMNYYSFDTTPPILSSFALRYLVYPMNSNGSVITVFGTQDLNTYHFVNLAWSYGSFATWTISQAGSPYSTPLGDEGYVTLDPNQWHMMEIRLRGSSVELWIDLSFVGQQVVLEYEPGAVGFGVGLNEFETGTTFSAAFDDIVVYTLVD